MIVASIVLYNPDQTVIKNIKSYLDDVDLLFAIDNSETINHEIVNFISKNSKIHYINNNGNQGIAQALNVAAKKALEKGYQWLLMMDQDSSFTSAGLNKYFHCIRNIPRSEQIAIFSPNRFANPNAEMSCSFTEKLITITSGSLLNLTLYRHIGNFNESLFIDEVDHDYCLRAHLCHYKVIEFDTIFLCHQIGNQETIKRHGQIQIVNIHSPLRHYYITRNCLYIFSKFHNNFPEFTRRRFLEVGKTLLFALIYGPKRLKRLKYILKAFGHFLIGRKGKYGR
ncbi:MAG: glycosyltransferase [Campylobacterales bacterium]|nr:glycosyltransferase [Campylobacterales bacterium]